MFFSLLSCYSMRNTALKITSVILVVKKDPVLNGCTRSAAREVVSFAVGINDLSKTYVNLYKMEGLKGALNI